MSQFTIFQDAIRTVLSSQTNLFGLDLTALFNETAGSKEAVLKKINSAFLILLCGPAHPDFNDAVACLDRYRDHDDYKEAVSFYQTGAGLIAAEIEQRLSEDPEFNDKLIALLDIALDPGGHDEHEVIDRLYNVFFPEGIIDRDRINEEVDSLRRKRNVTITQLNNDHVNDPARELLLTSNVLLTVPSPGNTGQNLNLDKAGREQLNRAMGEEQQYWYDHPIPIGIEDEANEILYGLTKLDRALQFEQENGHKEAGARMNCVLSVSTTHRGLHALSRAYLESLFAGKPGPGHLSVYAFCEDDTKRIIDEVLIPAARRFNISGDYTVLDDIFGVDGEYGRHYSFLKAVAALWHVAVDSDIKATFKIDLDQVFPQDELVRETGSTFFQHIRTPLWGARGKDADGNSVNLSMVAGALVNEKDILCSLFTPDVPFPDKKRLADELVFFSTLPQALSTQAEMMVRYDDGTPPDGRETCLQRVHVTGGTNGILVDALRAYRPFTPTFIGRAEDQSYILSVLFQDGPGGMLRYVHKDGLIMRHDKHSFAVEAVESARIGKLIGDYIRILYFSYYVRALPWPLEKVKQAVAPFTGCFISGIPVTLVYVRFCLRAARFFREGKPADGVGFINNGVGRIGQALSVLQGEDNPLGGTLHKEKAGWDLYYTILDALEQGIGSNDPAALTLRDTARSIVRSVRLKV